MFIDGFDPSAAEAFRGLSTGAAERFYAIMNDLARRVGVEVEGIHRIPSGRALIVTNHAFGFDAVFPMAAVHRETGRLVWALGEHAWWKIPFLRRLASAVGTVDGTRDNAERLLDADQLVLVLPGGLREAMKPRELRYRLLWGNRYGFIRTAIRTNAPIVPLASIGADEIFDLVGNAFQRGQRWMGRPRFPIPWSTHPIPHRVKLRYVFGEPIRMDTGAESANDPEHVRRARREVEGALQELIDVELARRAGFDLSGTRGE
jgi:1-acyl-sn-glycerol-3-phosphate acyltransferase